MSPRKLTSSNKNEILDLYRRSPETTSTLADRYGVSSSTISRFLKSHLSETEYEELIQQKRLGRTSGRSDAPKTVEPPVLSVSQKKVNPPIPKKSKVVEPEEFEDEVEEVNVATIQEMLGEDLADLDEDEEVLEGSDDDNWQEEIEVKPRRSRANLQVLPLSEASFPRTCYIVIDRTADLITRPLKEFADLGKIPDSEVTQKTLPVFDNQRVARRFSNRSQRVIKVPDGQMLGSASSYLAAKGITRLLIDGKVYALST